MSSQRPIVVTAAAAVAGVQGLLVARTELAFPPWVRGDSVLPLAGAVILLFCVLGVLRRSLAAAVVAIAVELLVLAQAIVSLANPSEPYAFDGVPDAVDARTGQMFASLSAAAAAVAVVFLLLQPVARRWLGLGGSASVTAQPSSGPGGHAARRERPPGMVIAVAVLFGLQGAVTIGTAIFATGRVDGSVLLVPAASGVALAVSAVGLLARQTWARYLAIGVQSWVLLRTASTALSEASSTENPAAYLAGALLVLALFTAAVVVLASPSVRAWFKNEETSLSQPNSSSANSAGIPPGWHPDGTGALRWWDGTAWTAHTAAPSTSTAVQDPFLPMTAEQPKADLRSVGAFLAGLLGSYIVVFMAVFMWFDASGPHTEAQARQAGQDSFGFIAIIGGLIGVPVGLWLAKLVSRRR